MTGSLFRKYHLFACLCGLVMGLAANSLSAQSGLGAAGGHVKGENLHFSYSVGQVFSTVIEGSGYYISRGIQHPSLMVYSTTPPELEAQVELLVYPNPVADELHIELGEAAGKEAVLQLLNMKGQKLLEQPIENEDPVLSLAAFAPGKYLLRVLQHSSPPTTFIIIKSE